MTDTVLVVGAGPTGLALAVHLAMNDIPVRVIDAAEGPATTSRALGVQPRGVEVLQRIGALGDLPNRSQSLLNMYYNEGPRTVLRLQVGKAVGSMPKKALLISQAEVEGALRDRFAALGGKVEWSTQLLAATQTAEGVSATVHVVDGSEQQLTADWLVGCDGAHSAVRKIAGIGFPGRKLIERLLMVDVHAYWPYDRNGSTTWMETGRMLSVTALPDDVWRVFVEPPPGTPDNLPTPEIVDRVLGEFTRRSGIDRDTVTDVRWATEFRLHRRLAETYRRGRMLLAGDAAHIQSPSGGQGQNTGLGDAENLGWKLVLVARGQADQRLLDSYEAERRPLARSVLAATSTAVDIMLPNKRWKRLVRDWLVMPAIRLPVVQRRLLRAASQLDITYRRGSRWRGRKPQPGDRVPDIMCRRLDGTEITLHTAISGSWVILAGDHAEAAQHAEAAAALLGRVTPLVRVGLGEVMLIRPDGHLAWRAQPAPGKLVAWLTRVVGVHVTPATTPRSSTPRSTC